MNKLKLCPFCGGEAEGGYMRYRPHKVDGVYKVCAFVSTSDKKLPDEYREYHVECKNERCPTMPSTLHYKSMRSARAAWDRRHVE